MYRICKVICILCGIVLTSAIPAGAWTAGIDITTGQATYDLTYGIEPNTTVEFDNGVDTIVPPPAPGMTKYAYFVTTGTFRELNTDIRPETGWQLYVMSDENISITWDQTPVPLSLTLVTMTENDAVSRQVPDMNAEQSLSLEPGTHVVTIIATAATGSGNSDSGDPDYVPYHPLAVVTETSTPVGTQILPIPTSTMVQTENPADKKIGASTDVPIEEGDGTMTGTVPANTTSSPTQSPISAIIPLAGLGIFLFRFFKKQ